MSVEEIKRRLESLTETQQDEVSVFLFRLRHARNASYQESVHVRMADREAAHWLTPEEFERRLDERQQ